MSLLHPSTTLVVHCKRDPYDLLIDRTTPWGNPFPITPDQPRPAVIRRFECWLRTSTDSGAVWMRENVHLLEGKVLGCWCAPKACHGHVLVNYLNHPD